jgi:hypothetical protein
MDEITNAVLRRYVVHSALNELGPRLLDVERVGFTWQLIDALREHVSAAAAGSAVLRTAYHTDDVDDAIAWVLSTAEPYVRPVVSDTLADQLSYPLVRVARDVALEVGALRAAATTATDTVKGAPDDAHNVAGGLSP